jgi:hypothetical protein
MRAGGIINIWSAAFHPHLWGAVHDPTLVADNKSNRESLLVKLYAAPSQDKRHTAMTSNFF